jgi:elongation factor G
LYLIYGLPVPVIGYAIEPKKQADVDKLSNAIAKLVEEDQLYMCRLTMKPGSTVLKGMGELHLKSS